MASWARAKGIDRSTEQMNARTERAKDGIKEREVVVEGQVTRRRKDSDDARAA